MRVCLERLTAALRPALLLGLALAAAGCAPPAGDEPEPGVCELELEQLDIADIADIDCSQIARVVPTGTELYDDHALRRRVRLEAQDGRALAAEYGACLVVTDADCERVPVTLEAAASQSITALLLAPVADPEQAAALEQALGAFIAARPDDERIAVYRWGQAVTQISTPTIERGRLARLIATGLGSPDAEPLALTDAVAAIEGPLAFVQRDHASLRQLLVVGAAAQLGELDPIEQPLSQRWPWLRVEAVALTQDFDAALLDASDRLDATLDAGEQILSYCALDVSVGLNLQVAGGGPSLALDHVPVPGAEPGMSCEPGVSEAEPVYPEVIEISMSASQRLEYDARVAALSKEPFMAKLRTELNAPGLTVPVKLKLRGNNSLACDRKSYSLDFTDDQPRRWLEGSATDKFFLLSMCLDDRYIKGHTANLIMAALGLFAPKFRMVEVMLSGVSQGVYMLVEKPQTELERDNTRVRLIVRRGADVEGDPPELEHSAGPEDQALADYEALLSAAEQLSGDALLSGLEASMDLEQYLRWIALMSLLESGDYVDEVYFMSTEVSVEAGATQDFFSISTWDQDDIFSPCHNNGDFAMEDPYGLLYCAESRLDYAIFADPGVYARYVDTLEQTLAWLDQAGFDAASEASVDALLARIAEQQTRAAMIELLSEQPEALAYELFEDQVRAKASAMRAAFAGRRALVAERIAAYRQNN